MWLHVVDPSKPVVGPTAAGGPAGAPATFLLEPAARNPFAERTVIRYVLPSPSAVSVTIVDASGRSLRRWAGTGSLGSHALVWDGLDAAGRAVPAGVYFVRLECGGRTAATKVLRVR
jgi:hypothetical protein